MFTKEVQAVLSCCVWQPDDERMSGVLAEYHKDYNQHLYGFLLDDRVAGCIGIRLNGAGRAQIRHIAVHPDYRLCGIAKKMVQRVCAQWSLRYLHAETDDAAVGFYDRCGFSVDDLGEKFPGVRRYQCELYL